MPLLVHHQIHSASFTVHLCDKSQSPFCNWGISKSPPAAKSLTVSKSGIVTCMANSRRVKTVATQIRRELSDMLLTDKVLQYAVLPPRLLLGPTVILVTHNDKRRGVFPAICGIREVAMAGLKSKAKYVRGVLGKRMKLRLTPEIRFIEDESQERGSRVIATLDRIKDEKSKFQSDEELSSSSSTKQDGDWDEEDQDEGIVYVD